MTNTSKLPFNDEFTQVPSVIFDLMQHISTAQFAVLMVIVRKTYGWQKTEDIISLSQIAEITGMSQRSAHDALSELIERCFVMRRPASPEDMAAKRIKRKPSQQFWYTVNLVAIQIHLHKGAGTPMQNLHTNADVPMQNLHTNSSTPMQNLHTNEAIPMQKLHTQKKEIKEKELKESVFSSSFSSLAESESRVSNTLQAESKLQKAPTQENGNHAPDEAIAKTLAMWQDIRSGQAKRGEKKTLRDLCAKCGAQNVYRAIIAAKEAGKTDGVGWVKWWAENKAPETPAVDWSKYGGGEPDYMRDDYGKEVKTYVKMKVDGSMYGAPDKIVFVEETRVNGKLTSSRTMPDGFVPPNQVPAGLMASTHAPIVAPSGGLRRALAASIANNGPVSTYTGPAENLP